MKIAFLISELNVCGGTHKQFLKLIEYTERQGVDFFILTRNFNVEQTYSGFAKYADRVRLIPRKPFLFRVLGRLHIVNRYDWERPYIKDLTKDANIINVHDMEFESNFDLFEGKKLFWQVNDLPYYCRVGVSKNYEATGYTQRQFHKLQNNIQFVTELTVNVSKNAERIKNLFNRNAHILYCGISPINIIKDISLSQQRFKKRQINLLSSGVFFPYRNYETQIKVVRKLVDEGWDIQLNIFGKMLHKPYARKIKHMISQYGLNNNIKILGQVSDSKYRELHQNSDIFLFINIDQSWGLAVFEAQSCGMPVIVSKSVGAVEILNNGIDSIIVDPLNVDEICCKIVELVRNEEMYKTISGISKDFYKEWTWDKAYCSKMLELMSE